MAYRLTGPGKSWAARIPRSKDAESAVGTLLYESGEDSMEIEEISGEIRTSEDVALKVLNRLIGKGYVEET